MKESFETQLGKYRNMWSILAGNPWISYEAAALRSGMSNHESPFCSAAMDSEGILKCDNCPALYECPNMHIIRWKDARSTYEQLLRKGVSGYEVMEMTDTLRELAKRARDVTVSSDHFDK